MTTKIRHDSGLKNNRSSRFALAAMIAIGGVVGLVEAQTPGAPAAATAGRGRGAGGRGRGAPQFTGPSVSVRPETQPLARTQAATLLGWRVGVRTDAFGPLTFSEAAAKADAGGMASVEGVSTQKVSAEIAKNLDYNLTAAEIDKVKARLNELRLVMPAYDAGAIPGDAASRRKVFEFAKSLGADMIIGSADAASLADLDKLATELTMNVALVSKDPKSMVASMASLSERMGLSVDIGAWMEAGVKPLTAVAQLKNRLLAVNLRDRSAMGAKGHNVILGTGVAGVEPFLLEMSKLQPPTIQDNWPPTTDGGAKRSEGKPVYITLDPTGAGDPVASLTSSGAAFDKAVPPAVYYRISTLSRMDTITPFERVPAEERAKVDAAIPRHALVKPKKPRKLLVMDSVRQRRLLPFLDSAGQSVAVSDGQVHRRLCTHVRQQYRESKISEDQAMGRRISEQHRRACFRRSGGARRIAALRARRWRGGRTPRRQLGQHGCPCVRGADGFADRGAQV